MRRMQLFEFHDLRWFPSPWRDCMTDVMASFAVIFNVYRPVLSLLEEHVRKVGARQLVDLCSGGTGPIGLMSKKMTMADGNPIKIVMTDLYPNLDAFKAAKKKAGDCVDYCEAPVDAKRVPPEFDGFRTLFASFHHFPPDEAARILVDASSKRQGIAVFEYTERNLFRWAIPILLTPVFFWVMMPFVRPRRWSRFLWTYLVPVVPFMGAWDGFVSCLRTYSPKELEHLVEACTSERYHWQVGRVRSFGACRVTYLFGIPSGS